MTRNARLTPNGQQNDLFIGQNSSNGDIQMATFNDFGNTAEQIKTFCAAGCDPLTLFQAKMVENHLISLGSHVSHHLIMVALETRDPAVLQAVKSVSQALSLNTDFSYAEVVIKGD